ncbi:SEC-C domain-containing protein [Clostridium sp. 'deep sea']|uniref:Rho termination factor N-terminal domain-containing protein n=1 Tax=Clostridium sp. 'deep sea' TaxID=2779445 RepID=UPI00189649C9|nr:Rho termination factor N-terminal domain-containing protein [Clostridium sp. 'deep sea']QOR36283.1 SEC-C domain-containing protein [Clostridium sp. 'deep sea']
MNENCNVKIINVNLSEILTNLKLSELKSLAQSHKLKNRSKMKKQELITALEVQLKNPNILSSLNEQASEQNLVTFSELLVSEVCQNTVDFWQNKGYLFYQDKSLIVPADLALDQNEIVSDKALNSLVKDYCLAAINLYGIVSIKKFIEIYNSQNDNKLTKEDFVAIFNSQEIEYIKLTDNYIVAEYILVSDNLSIEQVLETQGDKPYYIPAQDLYLKYADDFYYDDSPHLEELRNYIVKNYTNDEEVVTSLVNDIQGLISVKASLDVILESFYKYKIQFKSAKQLKKIVPYITNVQNNTRIYTNRGFSDNELRIMRGQKPQNINTKPIKSKKIGRNEPCPCGSGKKYKKCCGR